MLQNIKFDFNNMFDNMVKNGISENELKALDVNIEAAYNKFNFEKGKGMLEWTELPLNQDAIVQDILKTAEDVRKNFDAFVVLGIGGSALGPMAVFQALKHLHYNELSKEKRGGPRFYVEDNIDPERMLALLDTVDIKKTMFNIITKSGATSETMSQYLIISDILKQKLGKDYNKNIIATTSASKGNLIKLANKEKFKTFYIPEGVGGRFSELSPVGLLPAAVLNIDIKAILKGAAHMTETCKPPNIYKNPALMAAALKYIAINKGLNINVIMPYADSLKLISDWHCQLWGESIGKAKDLQGKIVNVGQTPVKALGVTDQHSQLQLYTEGPYDKVVTFIAVDKFRGDVKIADGCEEFPDVNFLCGVNLSQLINTSQKATEFALTKANRLNETITLPEVNEYYIGALLTFFMIKTAYCGNLLNINTFDQPGVEEGKNAAYAMFGRKGFEEKKKELNSAKKKNNKFIL